MRLAYADGHMNADMGEASDVVGCPVCDAVYRLRPELSQRATRCPRCGYRITFGKTAALAWLVSLSATNVALLAMVVFLPFLELRAGQFDNAASVIDVVLGFSSGIMVPLALAVLAFILLLPLSRFLLLLYALGPIALGRRNFPNAARALRYAFVLKPWAMAEIFMVGVAVALVKLADLATIAIGPAFWIFALIVILNAYQDTLMCRHTLWTALTCNE
ncbi:paraquat-inducible protein A [Hasllibacter sp. MH4015]|uniref:paraquat-inducible protein A n=1 Tax=Hasllibacter sp. MH4015 TaxID=2854029 RepID=UPI001CD29B25|nr:paraquat-inducible protein A [Hasllibacter sp. MH4015]